MNSNLPTVSIPLRPIAHREFVTEARRLGLSVEDYLAHLALSGFGMPLAEVIESVFSDAKASAKTNTRRPRLTGHAA